MYSQQKAKTTRRKTLAIFFGKIISFRTHFEKHISLCRWFLCASLL